MRRKVLPLAGVAAIAGSLLPEGEPPLPLVDTDCPDTVVAQDLVTPLLDAAAAATAAAAGALSPFSCWLLIGPSKSPRDLKQGGNQRYPRRSN